MNKTMELLEKIVSSFQKIEEIIAGVDNLDKHIQLSFFKEAANLRVSLMEAADIVSGNNEGSSKYSVEYEVDGDIVRNDIDE
jgi:hypothetical protein